jgi:hypothetical protein
VHVVDIVGTGRAEARLLRHARTDIGEGAAVPPHLALARGDAPFFVDAALDTQRRRVFGDGVELLFHRERNLHRPARDQRKRRHQRLELDVELGAETAAEIRHLDAHLVLGPAEQARDLDSHERRPLRGGVDGDAVLARLGD